MASLVVENEDEARRMFFGTEGAGKRTSDSGRSEASEGQKIPPLRIAEAYTSIYEDKVLGKIPEEVCVNLIEKYQVERKELSAEVEGLEAKQDEENAEEFIRRLKKYTDVQELTREMCLELIECITVDEYAADKPMDIHIYYKLLEKPLSHKNYLEINKDDNKENN